MMLKRSTPQPKPQSRGASARLVRASLAGLAVVAGVAGLATGCLDRKVVKATPTTSNVFVSQIAQNAVDKIDLLFMIDNSVSMADKQAILEAAVPKLLGRLVTPICVDSTTGLPVNPASNADPTTGACPGASAPEFPPIGDIHIGIVSSSLGAHGGNVCSAPAPGDDPTITHLDDQGHLIGTKRPEVMPPLVTWNNSGFLAWDPSGKKNTPPGENNSGTLSTNFAAMVKATGEHGCGYEASLEAWYRFLIDPEPPASVMKVGNFTVRSNVGPMPQLDTTLLAQRAAFLRPDSLVAIVMLSDENDCSIRDDGVGWFVGASSHMPKSTVPCAANPNDPCCRSCAQNETSPPAGCMALSVDANCMGAAKDSYNTWDNQNDNLNLRCFNQKQRFGFDLLYPTSRYVDALTAQSLTLSDGKTVVTNPLYDPGTSGKLARDPSLVFLAGIVGVPWQDIATPDSLTGPSLTYLTATDMAKQDRWTQLLGNATASPPVPPTDPFMVEQIGPRSGANPNVPAELIVAPTSNNPEANHINGHEQNVPDNSDLQYACTFKLTASKMCAAGNSACDCSPNAAGDTAGITASNSPLCQPTGGGPAGTTQYYAKAYPGARELTVLRDFKDNAIVASICPKEPTSANPASDPNYGYNPAVGAIIDRLKDALKGKCLPRKLQHTDPKDTSSPVECEVIEAQKAGACDCTLPGRKPADPLIAQPVFTQLKSSGACTDNPAAGQTNTCDANGFCMCEITQEADQGLTDCVANQGAPPAGYCYIDDPASPLLKSCPDNQKQILRFVDDPVTLTKTPAQGAIAFIACIGANIGADGGS